MFAFIDSCFVLFKCLNDGKTLAKFDWKKELQCVVVDNKSILL